DLRNYGRGSHPHPHRRARARRALTSRATSDNTKVERHGRNERTQETMADSSDVKKVLATIKEQDVKYVDFRFTDPRGKWQHLAHASATGDEELLTEGVMFDGSSIAGWKAINESDMTLMPDCKTAVLDPFAAQTSLVIFCDVYEPLTGQPYARDPRS